MGFIGSQHLFFGGWLANMVSAGWIIFKGLGTIVLAFSTSMATGYAALIIKRMDKKDKDSEGEKRA